MRVISWFEFIYLLLNLSRHLAQVKSKCFFFLCLSPGQLGDLMVPAPLQPLAGLSLPSFYSRGGELVLISKNS